MLMIMCPCAGVVDQRVYFASPCDDFGNTSTDGDVATDVQLPRLDAVFVGLCVAARAEHSTARIGEQMSGAAPDVRRGAGDENGCCWCSR
jgi:hypothetical protein